MTLRWLEGFQATQNEVILGRCYTNLTGVSSTTYTDEYGRTQFSSFDMSLRTPAVVGSVGNTWFIGFGFLMQAGQLDTSPSASPGIQLRTSAGEQLRLEMIDASDTKPGGLYYKIRVMRGVTTLATTVERFEANIITSRRIYFEFKAVVRTGTNGSFELKYHTFKTGSTINTATWSAANTGINTANQGSDGADRFVIDFRTGASADHTSFTDLYICDDAGAKNNTYLGVLYIEGIKPQGNGSTLSWALAGTAANIEDAWDEGVNTQSTLEDDKRVTSSTIGQISLATMSDLSALMTTTIVGMQVKLYGKMETTGTRDVKFFYRKTTGSPAQIGTTILDLDTTTIVGEADTQENDPNTGTTWVLADINGIQLGASLDA